MFMGPIESAKPWDINGIEGSKKFLDRVWRIYAESDKIQEKENKNLERIYHFTVKKVTNDYETMNFNTAVSQMDSVTQQNAGLVEQSASAAASSSVKARTIIFTNSSRVTQSSGQNNESPFPFTIPFSVIATIASQAQ